jgi:transposase-like protein
MIKRTGSRRRFTAAQKATILRRHLADKVPVSDLCDENTLQPSVFYTWQKQALENLEASLVPVNGPGRLSAAQSSAEKQVDRLKARIATKDEVIAEVTAEMVSLKKELGEL